MILEFILGFVIGYALTPLMRIHVVLHDDKMYESNGDGEEEW